MLELLKTAITGINIIPTTLLGLAVLYWLVVIIGAIDIDFLDFDLDVPDAETITSPFYGILAFLNIADLPFMLVYSIMSLCFWTVSMLANVLPFASGGFVGVVLLIANLLISVFITKVITQPLKTFFRGSFKPEDNDTKIEGKLCTLLCDLTYGRLGQAEIEREGASIIINVKVAEGENLLKDDKAFVVKKDLEKNFYIIKKFEGVN